MRKERIEGIGSIVGGEYESIEAEGLAKLKGDVKAETFTIEGFFKSKGRIEAKTLKIEGVHRAFRDIKAEEVIIDGILKLKRASLMADRIKCDGVITCTEEINTDKFDFEGVCSIASLVGDQIKIRYARSSGDKISIDGKFARLISSYFGRKLDAEKCIVDSVECTSLTASGTKFKTVRAHSVQLSDYCEVDVLYVDGEAEIDSTCVVRKIIKESAQVIVKEEPKVASPTLTKIMDLYKEGKINADEAEKMIEALKELPKGGGGSLGRIVAGGLPWADDGKLRVVAFLGHELLEKSAPESKTIEVTYNGEAVDVDVYGSLSCGDVEGNVSAGGSVKCSNVGGDVKAGGSITCGNIDGNVNAGGSVTCSEVTGEIRAGGGVRVGK